MLRTATTLPTPPSSAPSENTCRRPLRQEPGTFPDPLGQEPGTLSPGAPATGDAYRRFATTGRCILCGESIAISDGAPHWRVCAPRYDDPDLTERRLLLLRFTADDPAYFLDLELDTRASLVDLDRLLRQTWLDCPPPCRHRSLFEVWGVGYPIEVGDRRPPGRQLDTHAPLGERLRPGLSLRYLYDFEAPTLLKGSVLAERRGRPAALLHIVARNLRPRWTCSHCDDDAFWICPRCRGRRPALFCAPHADEHHCGSRSLRPLADSPRMGCCRFGE